MFQFPPLLPLTRRLLVVLFGAFVAELVLQNWVGVPVFAWLSLQTGGLGLPTLWQLLTYPLVWPPGPGSVLPFLVNLLFLWWILSPYEAMAGARETAWLGLLASVGGGLAGALAGLLFGQATRLSGTGPLLLGVIAAYAWRLRGRGTLSFFGVLPMRPEQLVWVVLGLSVLFFLASGSWVDLVADLAAVGIGVGFVHFGWRPPGSRRHRRRGKGPRLVGLPGGRSGDGDRRWVH